MRQALKAGSLALFDAAAKKLKKCRLSKQDRIAFDALEIWSFLVRGKKNEASDLFLKYPKASLQQETSPLHFPFGAWLFLVEGKEAAMRHFSLALETPYPPTTALPSLFLTGKINDKKGWIEKAFWWEKKELHRQVDLFYKTIGKSS